MPVVDRIIRWAQVVTVLAVAGVAAWVSYWHAVEVIRRAGGEDELATHLIPATLDGLALSGSLVLLFAARYQLTPPLLARVALVMEWLEARADEI